MSSFTLTVNGRVSVVDVTPNTPLLSSMLSSLQQVNGSGVCRSACTHKRSNACRATLHE
jgi:aerobic-type carbon monoxide dehydrogenase small subunit (CoxS/CutS family)